MMNSLLAISVLMPRATGAISSNHLPDPCEPGSIESTPANTITVMILG